MGIEPKLRFRVRTDRIGQPIKCITAIELTDSLLQFRRTEPGVRHIISQCVRQRESSSCQYHLISSLGKAHDCLPVGFCKAEVLSHSKYCQRFACRIIREVIESPVITVIVFRPGVSHHIIKNGTSERLIVVLAESRIPDKLLGQIVFYQKHYCQKDDYNKSKPMAGFHDMPPFTISLCKVCIS